MSSKKTPNLNMHKWEGSDDFIREEINENFDILDTKTEELKADLEAQSRQIEEVDGKKLDKNVKSITVQNPSLDVNTGKPHVFANMEVDDYQFNLKVYDGMGEYGLKNPSVLTINPQATPGHLTFNGHPVYTYANSPVVEAYAKAYTTNTTLPRTNNEWRVFPWNAFARNKGISGSPGEFHLFSSGFYQVNVSVRFLNLTVGENIRMALYHNGAYVATLADVFVSGTRQVVNASYLIEAEEGDTLQIYYNMVGTTNAGLNANQVDNYFQAVLVEPFDHYFRNLT